MTDSTFNSRVDEILKGSIDLHVHSGPDPYKERRMDALETAKYAYESEMGGFVLKSHEFSTVQLAQILQKMYPRLKVFGSITLNTQIGGLNPSAVEAAAIIGAKVVWMPTYDSNTKKSGGISLTNSSGILLPEVIDIIDIAVEHKMVIASGHASPRDAITLFATARDRGGHKLIATHPLGVASNSEINEMVAQGAYVEWTFLSCMPSTGVTDPKSIATSAKEIGIGKCLITTDFGQWMNPPASEGMRMAIASMIQAGLSDQDITTLVKDNPIKLISPDNQL